MGAKKVTTAKRQTRRSAKKADPVQTIAAQSSFARGVLVRGEAAKPEGGRLPKDATHAIVEDEDGRPVLQRHKFKLF